MKKIICFMFVITCFVNTNLTAMPLENLFQNMKKHCPGGCSGASKVRPKNSNEHIYRKAFGGESFQATFLRAPNELSLNFNEETYKDLISMDSYSDCSDDDDDYDDDDGDYTPFPQIEFDILFPKESHFCFDWSENPNSIHLLDVSKLQKGQDQVVTALATYIAELDHYFKNQNSKYETNYFEYTPLQKDKKGHYSTTFSLSECELADDDDDDTPYEQHIWGKMVISKKNFYFIAFFADQNTPSNQKEATRFLNSLEVKK